MFFHVMCLHAAARKLKEGVAAILFVVGLFFLIRLVRAHWSGLVVARALRRIGCCLLVRRLVLVGYGHEQDYEKRQARWTRC